ncbi:MAG: hypothetical protein NTX64_16410 [Elusimicrobia bacterium]|nr:hypothetical protein [Elusimicrobiota bacterium]
MIDRGPKPGEFFDEDGPHGGGGAAPAEAETGSEEKPPPRAYVYGLPPHPRLLRPAAAQAPMAQAPMPGATQVFMGSNDNGGYHPPDTMGAVGPNGIFTVSNNNIRYLNRSGGIVWGSSLSSFFPVVGGTLAYDPKVYYDATSARFFAVALDAAGTANSSLLIAVSQNSNPGQYQWYTWRVPYGGTGAGNWIDYPSIGISSNWFAFSGTAFQINSPYGYQGVDMYLFSKSVLVNGTWNNAIDNVNARWFGLNWDTHLYLPTLNGYDQGFVLMPSIDYDAADSDLWFVQGNWWNGTDGTRSLRFFKLTGAPPVSNAVFAATCPGNDCAAADGTANAGLLNNIHDSNGDMPPAKPTQDQISGAPQRDSTSTVHIGDDRIESVVLRNHKLWVTQNVGCDGTAGCGTPKGQSTSWRAAVAWYCFQTGGNGADTSGGNKSSVCNSQGQQGFIDDASGSPIFYYFGSIAVDANDNVALGFSGSSANQYVGAFISGRYNTDTVGTMRTPTQYQAGADCYYWASGSGGTITNCGAINWKAPVGTNRWGDFSATMADPAQTGVFWTVQQLAAARIGSGLTATSQWVTSWAQFTLSPPLGGAPSNFAGVPQSQSQINFSWTALPDAVSYNYNTALDGSGKCQAGTNTTLTSFSVTGQAANTSVTRCVSGVNANGVGPGVLFTTATFAQTVAVGTLDVPACSGTNNCLITASYTAACNSAASGYIAEAHLAADYSDASAATAVTNNSCTGSLTIYGLKELTGYYVRVGALNSRGNAQYANFGLVATKAYLVAPNVLAPSAVSSTSIQFNWGRGTNPATAQFVAQLSVSNAVDGNGKFTTINFSSATGNLFAVFNGLSPNTLYYFQVQAVNGPWATPSSTPTLAAVPSSVALAGPTNTVATLSWGAGSDASHPNPGDTNYEADASLTSDFSSGVTKIVTTAHTATTSASVHFAAFPASPPSASCEGFEIDAALDPAFSVGVVTNRSLDPTITTLGVDGLTNTAVYYIRIAPLGPGLQANNFTVLGTTATPHANMSSAPVAASGPTVITVTPSSPQATSIALTIPQGALPTGTQVQINASLNYLPPVDGRTNGAVLIPLGTLIGVDVNAAGLQPSAPVPLVVTYDPALIPPGRDPMDLRIAMYDAALSGTWVTLPTQVDTVHHTLTAHLSHFSLYAPFFVLGASDCDGVKIYPTPFKPGSGTEYDWPAVHFENTPDGGTVQVFTLRGELVWEGTASGGDVLWDGKNRCVHPVATGVYPVSIGLRSKRCLKRVVVVR